MRIGEALKEISVNNVSLAEKQQQVYDAGVAEGRAQGGYTEGFDAGRQAEYDAFWDTYQFNGTKKDYKYAFSYYGWADSIFKPKYDIKPEDASSMFTNTYIVDLAGIIKERGIVFDTSMAKSLRYTFSNSGRLKTVPVVDTRSATDTVYLFAYSQVLESVEKIILKEDGSNTFDYWFNGCTKLANVTFEGVIGQNLNISYTKVLSHGSIVSIISALSTETTDKTVTLSKTAVNNAFEGGSTGSEWLDLIATKSNWTISLV